MRKLALLVLALFATLAVTAQYKVNPSAPQQKSPIVVSGAQTGAQRSFPRISQADALKLYKEGKAVFIDVRSNQQFQLGHIKDALSIPGSQIVTRFEEVPIKKTVITYCACTEEQSSGRAAADLIAHGVKAVYALKGGWNEWKANGYPRAVGPK
ncbi:MAG: rhodanese-like domain-containing protein [Thermoanaerobaculia bacterium]